VEPQDNILIVDDEEGIRLQLKWALNPFYQVTLASNAEATLQEIYQKRSNVVLLDIALSPTDEKEGIRLLETILKLDPTIKVIMMTGHDTRENALQAIERGAFDFHPKPVDVEEIRIVIKRALYIQALERENQTLRLATLEDSHSALIGKSSQMLDVIEMIRRVAATDITVLIYGESGTGKEVVAREIHRLSNVPGKFITVNCGAIPRELMESELFGHEKGAFTDAHRMKRGKLEEANRGTAFLDEIAELPLELQVKMLRFLQEREIERLGGLAPIPITARVLAATNQDLEAQVEKGAFREDLYYRLNVVTISIPPLRERRDDIILLANAKLHQYNKDFRKKIKGFTQEAIEAMMHYPWPGNIRELQNRIQRGMVVAHGDRLTEDDLGLTPVVEGTETLQQAKDALEREFVERALIRHKGNISKAADAIGVTRVTFYDLLKKHAIDIDGFRG